MYLNNLLIDYLFTYKGLIRIEEYNCRRMEKIFKLDTISIMPSQISLNTESFIESSFLTVFKLEVWLNHIMLDQTHQIHISERQDIDGKILLQIDSKPFRYYPKELFSKSKVIRFKLVLLRGDEKWEQVEEVQAFALVLSEYSYNIGKSKQNQFHQHSVGLFKKSIFFYKIRCEYEEQKPATKFVTEQDENGSYVININEKKQKKESQQTLLLPLNSLPDDASLIEADSEVFIELSRLKPVFRNELNVNKHLRIKVQESHINAQNIDSQIIQMANEKQSLNNSKDSLLNILFYTYLLVCLVVGIIQMSPQRKV